MKIEIKGKYKGFNYIVIAQPMGYRCGYVEIPKGHTLYGLDYSAQLPITFKEISKQSIGKRGIISVLCAQRLKKDDKVSMDLLFNVHGGITFSGEFKKGKGWWIGFDCAHAGDGRDISIMDKRHKEMNEKCHLDFDGDVIRIKKYVEKECKSLINQIKKYFK